MLLLKLDLPNCKLCCSLLLQGVVVFSFIALKSWLGRLIRVIYCFETKDIFFYTQKKQQRMNVVHNKLHICVNRLYPSKKAPYRSSLMTEDIDQVSWQKIVSLFNTFLPPVKFTPIHNKTRNNSPALPWGWLCNYFFTHYTHHCNPCQQSTPTPPLQTLVNNQHLSTYIPRNWELTGDRSDVTEVEVPHLSLLFLKMLPLRHSTICLF
jgi:hypothetical protein